jgi:hypothetical protein
VCTDDVDRAPGLARLLRCGTAGHNAFRTDLGIAFGGFKQSGIGREGGTEGLVPFLETKTVILDGSSGRVQLAPPVLPHFPPQRGPTFVSPGSVATSFSAEEELP